MRLLNVLRNDHRNFAFLLDILDRQIIQLRKGERTDLEVIEAVLNYLERYGDQCHHPRENLVYAKLRERSLEAAELSNQVQKEHRALAMSTVRAVTIVRSALSGRDNPERDLAGALADLVVHYRGHIAAEEGTLFPSAKEHLTDQDWDTIMTYADELAAQEFAFNVQDRFVALRDYIHSLDRLDRDQ